MPLDPDQIDYAARRHWLRNRRIGAWVTIIIVVLAVLPVAVKFAKLNGERMRARRLMETCLHYAPPPVVFSTASTQQVTSAAAPWLELTSLRGITINSTATLFLHERHTSKGEPMLVAVDLVATSPQDPMSITLSTRNLTAAGSLSQATITTIELAPQRVPFTISAGQADDVDHSHFTITCTIEDRSTILDGWLRDDGSVLIEPRTASTY